MRIVLVLWCSVLAAGAALAQSSGKVLFDGHCSRCHGIGGTGGEGPSLAVPVLRHAADDETLASVITDGIPDTDMPGNWMLGTREVEQVIQYVRSLSRAELEEALTHLVPSREPWIFPAREGSGRRTSSEEEARALGRRLDRDRPPALGGVQGRRHLAAGHRPGRRDRGDRAGALRADRRSGSGKRVKVCALHYLGQREGRRRP